MTPGRDIEPRLGQIPCLEEMLDRMIAVLPDKPDQAFRFLDLGGGAGTVSERLLTKFTETDCTLIEATEAERDQAGERLVTFGDRVTIIDGDFARVELPRDFDLVVSLGRFHGLWDIERRAVYRAAYSVLLPGGQLLVADQVQGPTERLEAIYQTAQAADNVAVDQGVLELSPRLKVEGREPKGIFLNNDLAWMATVGFRDVDIFYKNMRYAVFGGRRPVASEHTFSTLR